MIPFLDLAADFAEVEADARARLDGVLARQQFVLGPETAELEREVAALLGARSAVAVSSGTDALSLALLALGIGPGSAVVLPAFTYFATAGSVVRAGAVPVFCDIDPVTFLAGAAEMRAAIDREFRSEGGALRHRASGARLAALMPVHLYGRACGMDDIVSLARSLGVRVVEDAAQAVLARIPRAGEHRERDGDRAGEGDHGGDDGAGGVGDHAGGGLAAFAGAAGDVGCLSFYPTKNLGGAGDGGMVLTDDAVLGARLARLRTHGAAPGGYEHDEVGVNARMGEMVAAVLNAKLARLAAWTRRRRAIAAAYAEGFADAEARGLLQRPAPGPAASHVWHQYALRVGEGRRDDVQARAAEAGVATRVFYPIPLHLQPALASLGGRPGDLPHCEAACREVLCLPVFASLGHDAVAQVVDVVTAAAANVATGVGPRGAAS